MTETPSPTKKEEIKKSGPPTSGNIRVLCRFRPLNEKEKENAK